MELDRETIEILRPAAERLRRVLQRIDSDDVPPTLRPLADTSARRLPPPLLRRALMELDDSEWLRAEILADGELEQGTAEELFVVRPDDWEFELERLVAESEDQRREDVRSHAERELAEALSRITLLEEQLRAGDREVASAERRARDRLRAEVESAERGRRRAEVQAREAAQESSRLASRVERLEAELRSARERIETLRALLEKERRAATPEPARQPRGWFPDEPLAMADELDRIFAAVRLEVETDVMGDDAPPAAPVELPPGIRPDRGEAVAWLMRHPLRWMIDGYNVAFQVADEPDAVTRSRIVSSAGRLAALAAPGSMVVVVFDSSVDSSSLPADRRVRVVYAPSADEWIIEHAGANTAVVSSDRRVRESAQDAGAHGLWAEAFAGWMSGGAVGP